MPVSTGDVRWDVVDGLYSRLRGFAPGSDTAEVAEHAISLAISGERTHKSVPFLLHDVWRNAQYSVRRSRERRAALVNKAGAELSHGGEVVERETPESLYLAQELATTVRRAVAGTDRSLVECLDGMLRGDTVAETRAAMRASRSSVDRARQRVREIAYPLAYGR